MNDDSHFLMSLGAEMSSNNRDYYAQRCRKIADEIERLRSALDEIRRHCGDNGETPADRGGRWAAQVASDAMNIHKRGED